MQETAFPKQPSWKTHKTLRVQCDGTGVATIPWKCEKLVPTQNEEKQLHCGGSSTLQQVPGGVLESPFFNAFTTKLVKPWDTCSSGISFEEEAGLPLPFYLRTRFPYFHSHKSPGGTLIRGCLFGYYVLNFIEQLFLFFSTHSIQHSVFTCAILPFAIFITNKIYGEKKLQRTL